MKKPLYFDYAASTPLDPKVWKAMLPFLKTYYGNPSSNHSLGQKTRAAIEQAREEVARFLHCKPLEVVFTSGATEANNLAIRGLLGSLASKRLEAKLPKPHVITSQIEHESVLSLCEVLEQEGIAEITHLQVDKGGIVRVEDVSKAIKEHTVLISIMYANSEIGTIQPIREIGELLRELKTKNQKLKTVFHTDAVQAAPFLDCDVEKLGVDLLTLSGHKIYGPKGTGVLYVREDALLSPLFLGGGQEGGMRSGTENVAGIVGMGAAIQAIQDPRFKIQTIRIRQMRDALTKKILVRVPNSSLTGSRTQRLANNLHFCFNGIEGRDLVIALDQKGICVSTGSACSEKNQEPSHVLLALAMSPQEAMSCIRITLGKYTTHQEVEKLVRILPGIIDQLRKKREKL